jgi:hypothetical protein
MFYLRSVSRGIFVVPHPGMLFENAPLLTTTFPVCPRTQPGWDSDLHSLTPRPVIVRILKIQMFCSHLVTSILCIGLTLAGITGKVISEFAQGITPSIDTTPFRPDRFG